MRILGIVAEYNPFHNGHKYQLEKAKRELSADYVIAIMSGNFVQRGEPAIIHKWKRAEMCLQGGVDLVIELPVHYATASAEIFAEGAVKILDCTSIVNFMSFGAETDCLSELNAVARRLLNETSEYKLLLKKALSEGKSFPASRAIALSEPATEVSGISAELYGEPNNILAIEYLKALNKINSKITPHIVLRHAAKHNSDALNGQISSAGAIRKTIKRIGITEIEASVPACAYRILEKSQDCFPVDIDDFSDILSYKIKAADAKRLRQLLDVSEGIENRIISAADCETARMIISQIKTKRYTFTKIQRILMHILLDITTNDMNNLRLLGAPYVRVLGFRREASRLVGMLAENSSAPVIINLKKDVEKLNFSSRKIIEQEIKATDVYFIKSAEKSLRKKNVEFSLPPVII